MRNSNLFAPAENSLDNKVRYGSPYLSHKKYILLLVFGKTQGVLLEGLKVGSNSSHYIKFGGDQNFT